MKALRVFVALAITASMLVAGARAGASGPPQALAEAGDVYPGAAAPIGVGDSVEVAGQRMQVSLFSTPDAPGVVARFYADAFRARRLTPVLSVESDVAHVASFDPAESVQRFVTAVAQRDGGTLVMSGSIDTRRPPSLDTTSAPKTVPVPSAHRALLTFRSVDASSTAESAQFLTALPPEQVAAFYRSTLAADGYTQSSTVAGSAMLSFVKGAATISLAMQRLGDSAGAAVFITRSEAGAR